MEAGGEFVLESAVAGEVIEWVVYFRYWAQSRRPARLDACPLLEEQRTYSENDATSAFDPDCVKTLPML